ncbi:MAG TPA: branched-chain amino acid--2-keto-4-methylthiobutyrate aminotransferase [Gammaproteobacteria bacterium]|nr:branched-chain amino acid--2-keto-4-methylthiobutyrate aminotransferase [Gammaproteobacteria bacterium]
MDRGFLFGDGVYEVIPVYNRKLLKPIEHLNRLQKSLDSVSIKNPYNESEWLDILIKLMSYSISDDQSIYLQITRGSDTKRVHTYKDLKPSIYIESNILKTRTKKEVSKGYSAITMKDIRWDRCNIKSTSLLANILYSQEAKKANAEEAILHKNNVITEGSTSNVFLIKNGVLFTHPAGSKILSGITREMVLESAKSINIIVKEEACNLDDIYDCDEVWISSSTRGIIPITKIDDKLLNNGVVGKLWKGVYEDYLQYIKLLKS